MQDIIIEVVRSVKEVEFLEIKGVEKVEFTGRQVYIEDGSERGYHFRLDEVGAITLGKVASVDVVYYDTTVRVDNVSEMWLSASDGWNMDTLCLSDGGCRLLGMYVLDSLQAVEL